MRQAPKIGKVRNYMLNRPSIAVNKWAVVLVGAVLAMIAMLLISSPAPYGIFAHDDPVPDDHDTVDHVHYVRYNENGTGAVRYFTSRDPEGSGIEWNVRGVDAADFMISSTGVLTFRESPDFENPTDRGLNLNPGDDADFDDTGEFAPNDNDYQITVSATEMTDALSAKRTDIALTVIVGNADDTGEVTLQWLQPEVGTLIRATLTDPDGDISGISTWTWYTSKVLYPEVGNYFHWDPVTDTSLITQPPGTGGKTVSAYTPAGDTVDDANDAAVDERKHLQVRVEYTDPQSSTVRRTLYGISMNPVRAEVSSPGDNGSPDFEEDTDTRTVPESTAVGDPVGDAVAATDPDDDTLTYELIEVASPNDGDNEFFDIDMATGQITVAQNLDYDAVGDRTAEATASEYKVIVRATDPSGLADDIMVTITAENVNEDPIVTGQAELSVAEGTDEGYTILPDAPAVQPNNPGSRTYTRNEYVFEEPDYLDSIADWHLEGDDAGAFDLSGGFEPRYIQLKEAPDYENPTDLNRDNVYEVTLVATDTDPLKTGSAGIGKVNVWLIVTNVEEAPMIMVGGLAVSGMSRVDYAEDRRDDVATYRASGPDAASATWTLEGDDAGDFDISSSGVLTFRASPNYETPADADTDNTYEVTVVASDGTNEDRLDVTITVTDVDERPPVFDPLAEYDADSSGAIEKDEVLQAINDYLFGEGADAISKGDVIETINLYLFG